MTIRSQILRGVGLLTASVLALGACSSGSTDEAEKGSEANPIRIGVVTAAEPYWDVFTDIAEDEGIHVEFVNFTDYQLPNQGLADGDLDLNQFQHLQFLAEFNHNAEEDLTPIGATAVYPLGLYSTKHDSVDDIPEGGEIAIPNDSTNQARALLVLQEAGLIALEDGGNSFSTPIDVIEDESQVSVTAVDAAQTPLALEDVDASIINNDWVGKADLTADDAIFSDDPHSDAAAPYINVWVARADQAENEIFAKLVEIYHEESVEESAQETAGGTAAFLDTEPERLQEILAEIESNIS